MATLDSALRAVRSTIMTALNAAGITPRGQVIVGFPTATEWEEVAGQDGGGSMVSIWPLPGAKYDDPNPVNYQIVAGPNKGTLATIGASGTNCTITGNPTPLPGDTVHLFFSGAQGHANYLVKAGDNPNTIAAALAVSISNSGVPGVAGSAVANVISITGSVFEKANTGGTGTVGAEVARVTREIMVTVWTSSANDNVTSPGSFDDREQIGEAIIAALGTATTDWLTDVNGDFVYITQKNDRWDDQASDSYTTFRWDIFYSITYSVMQTTQYTQLEAVQNIVPNHVPATIWAR